MPRSSKIAVPQKTPHTGGKPERQPRLRKLPEILYLWVSQEMKDGIAARAAKFPGGMTSAAWTRMVLQVELDKGSPGEEPSGT